MRYLNNIFVLILTGPTFSYVCSRIYLQDPPGEDSDDEDMPHPEITAEALCKELELAEAQPDVNPLACIITLIITVGLMGVTAEFVRLLPRLGPIVIFTSPLPVARQQHTVRPSHIKNQRRVRSSYFCGQAHAQNSSHILPYHRWFSIILLPFVSFSVDGAVAIVFFIRSSLRQFFMAPEPPDLLARARAIDLSIQFLLLWMASIYLHSSGVKSPFLWSRLDSSRDYGSTKSWISPMPSQPPRRCLPRLYLTYRRRSSLSSNLTSSA